MRHRVENNVNAERVRDFLGEIFEEVDVFAFPLPTIAVVGVVRGDDHHASFVVVDRAMVHGTYVAIVAALPSHSGILAISALPKIRDLPLGLDFEDAVVNGMVERQLYETAIRKNLLEHL